MKAVVTLPFFINVAALVNDPITEAILFVAKAAAGSTPVSKITGRDIIPPPPAIESTKPEMNPPHIKNIIVLKSSN